MFYIPLASTERKNFSKRYYIICRNDFLWHSSKSIQILFPHDEGRHENKSDLALCCDSCNSALTFRAIFQIVDQMSDTISITLISVVERLWEKNLIVTAVFSDNISKIKAMSDPIHDYSLQTRAQFPILWMPCWTHPVDLAIHLLWRLCRRFDIRTIFQTDPRYLMTGKEASGFGNCPRFVDVWSFWAGEEIYVIAGNNTDIAICFASHRQSVAILALDRKDWGALDRSFSEIFHFIAFSGANDMILFDIFEEYLRIMARLQQWNANNWDLRNSVSCLAFHFDHPWMNYDSHGSDLETLRHCIFSKTRDSSPMSTNLFWGNQFGIHYSCKRFQILELPIHLLIAEYLKFHLVFHSRLFQWWNVLKASSDANESRELLEMVIWGDVRKDILQLS
jgi:hypothetical protein